MDYITTFQLVMSGTLLAGVIGYSCLELYIVKSVKKLVNK